jgi:PRC-barrel domain/Domain of unknown function (DUF2382)
MRTPSIETVRAWLGRVMIDRDGNRIGEITDIYLDNESGRPDWAVVRTGLFGLRSTFVPLAEAIESGEQVQIRHQRSHVKDAPNIEPDGQLSAAEEAELYRHYELDYDAEPDPSGRAGPPTRQPDSTDTNEPPRPTAQDPLPVGEGLSRPFVYETPGAPEAGPGIPRRQPGQVRLRRYLVTEIVTETESGQRHEVRVEREPINDAEVDALTATPTRADESIPDEPTRADSDDWFRADDPRN